MTETGDWTVVKGDQTTNMPQSSSSSSSHKKPPACAVRFPCMEQPPRYALRSASTGIYLGGTKKGRLIGRKHRTEHDEWTIALVGEQTNTNTSIASLQNHKHGNLLSMVLTDTTDLGRTVACVQPPLDPNHHDLGLETTESNDSTDNHAQQQAQQAQEPLPSDEDGDDEHDVTTTAAAAAAAAPNRDDMQWCIIRCSDDNPNAPNGGVTIVSTKTGDCLSVSSKREIILSPYEPFHVWELECVTGELCFLSNPRIDARVRCDMAGLLTLSPNWKGWEVVRITEASNPHSSSRASNDNETSENGYVRISSWMHNQWFLCSDAKGNVGTCSVAESLLAPPPSSQPPTSPSPSASLPTVADNEEEPYRCSKWAIEKYPTDENSEHEGLIIRSVTHGRLLSIHDGLLKTFDSLDEMRAANHADFINTNNTTESLEDSTAAASNDSNLGSMVKHRADELKRNTSNWWKQSLTNVQKAVSDNAIQRRNSKLIAEGKMRILPSGHPIPQEDTIVWQLESAHLQTYYFLSSSAVPGESSSSVPRSIGAFPALNEHLRKSDKIRLVRNDASPHTLKLYLPEENFFILCTAKGCIQATKHEEDPGTEWTLQDHESGGSIFYNPAHNLYLSFRNENSKIPPEAAFAATTIEDDTQESPKSNNNKNNKLQSALENLKLPHPKPKAPTAELCGTETPTVWNLEPCTPRAISSKRLKTFAIGTSIAVGTTIAMPFAIAGVAAAMGALGAEAGIGFGIVAAAATGAEAIASVGAIGATAYFCFKPEQNSLNDDMDDETEEENSKTHQAPWSKRPFANWRNW